MVYTPAWDTAVSREAPWWTTDPPTGWVGTAPPVLQAANGGPFDHIQAYRPLLPPAGKCLFIERDYTQPQPEQVEAMGEMREWRHFLVVRILWTFTNTVGAAETEMQKLETAISDCLTRLRGVSGDRTHGGAFVDVGDTNGEPVVHFIGDPLEDWEASRTAEVHIRYVATDQFFD